MKITKTASGKIKFDQETWTSIGKKMGWVKEAMPVPLPPEHKRDMEAEGLYIITDLLKKMPNVGIRDMKAYLTEIKESGASEFFAALDPATAIQLPAVYLMDPSKVIEIDNEQYYLLDIDKSTKTKDGSILCLNLRTNLPQEFSYNNTIDQIRESKNYRTETLEKINKSVDEYNKKIQLIDKAAGASKLVLQFGTIEKSVNERLATLDGQIESTKALQEDPLLKSPAYGRWLDFLRDGVRNGSFSLQDTFDTLLFLYQATPDSLIGGINSGEIAVPAELRSGLLGIAAMEARSREEKSTKGIEKEEEQRQRMDEDLPPYAEPQTAPLRHITDEDLPQGKPSKLTQYKTLHSWAASLQNQINKMTVEKESLANIRDTFIGVRRFIGALEKGQRATEYLQSTDGAPVLEQLRSFLDAAARFIKRYEVDVIKDGKINKQLMGTSGQAGNAIIAIDLHRIYNIVKKTIDDVISGMGVPHTVEEIEEEKELTPIASNNKFEKLSEELWKSIQKRLGIE